MAPVFLVVSGANGEIWGSEGEKAPENGKILANFLTEFDPASSFQISDFPW